MAFVGEEYAIAGPCDEQGEPLASSSLAELRARARQLLQSQRDRVQHLEVQLLDHLQGLAREMQAAQGAVAAGEVEQRELRAELESRASPNQSKAPPADLPPSGGFDWESQKKRLLEQLESDFDGQDPGQKRDRLTVESTIRITDQVVAGKDREIIELRQLLENQASNLGQFAVGAAAVAELMDCDELVRQERENLRRMQEEWREKLRRAEVEISVERAKIARERVELEEKLRSWEAARANGPPASSDVLGADKGKSRSRGRWLTRLGLQDDGA